jgi:hypothetical protein
LLFSRSTAVNRILCIAAASSLIFSLFADTAQARSKKSKKSSKTSISKKVKKLSSRSGYDTPSSSPVVIGRVGVVTGENVPINAGREQYGRLLSRVPKGTNLTITGQTDDFYAVMMVDRSVGFISKSKVDLLNYEITSDRPLESASGPKGKSLVQAAIQYMGVPYLWGGNTMNGIDCSGFVKAVYKTIDINLPRTASEQASIGYDVPIKDVTQWQVGDRLYFQCHHSYIDHTGMYIGNGYFIHSHGGTGVSVTRVDHAYYHAHLVAVRRSSQLLTDSQPVSAVVSSPDMEASEAK